MDASSTHLWITSLTISDSPLLFPFWANVFLYSKIIQREIMHWLLHLTYLKYSAWGEAVWMVPSTGTFTIYFLQFIWPFVAFNEPSQKLPVLFCPLRRTHRRQEAPWSAPEHSQPEPPFSTHVNWCRAPLLAHNLQWSPMITLSIFFSLPSIIWRPLRSILLPFVGAYFSVCGVCVVCVVTTEEQARKM